MRLSGILVNVTLTAEAVAALVMACLWFLLAAYFAIGSRYGSCQPVSPLMAIVVVTASAAGAVVTAVQGNGTGFVIRLTATVVLAFLLVRLWPRSR